MKMGFPISLNILNPLILLFLTLCILGCTKGCVEREREALLDFKTSFASFPQNHGKLSSWNSSEDAKNCCTWEGITCDSHGRHVLSLDLSNQYLKSYELRPSLLELQQLRILDLSFNNLAMRIPEFIGSLSKLTTLSIFYAEFFGVIPPQLGNLSNIQTLYLGANKLSTDNFQWLSHIPSLEILDMSSVNISEARDWLSVISNLPFLSEFVCISCHFPTPDRSSTFSNHFNSSSSLQMLGLSYSILSSSTLSLLMNSTSNLSTVYATFLNLEGPFPNIFDHMTSLEGLALIGNHLPVGTFKSIGNLCNLKQLYASECSIIESLVDIIGYFRSCSSDTLETLDLGSNNLSGIVPPMLKFPSLLELSLDHNCLENFSSANLTAHHLFPASLSQLDMSHNILNGVLSSEYFTNLSQLTALDLTNNPNLRVSFHKPPTEIQYLQLSSCNLGPFFPSWLFALNNVVILDVSHSKIFGSIPILFWTNLPLSLTYFNISFNNLHGTLPNLPFQFSDRYPLITIDLSSNAFYGLIPSQLLTANVLNLSNNNFSNFAPLLYSTNLTFPFPTSNSISTDQDTNILDISDNNLSCEIPLWLWLQLSRFSTVNLANNKLSGIVPSPIGYTLNLYVLNLSNNSFFGPLPSLIKNCTKIRILDLSENKFSGLLPSWLGEGLKGLVVLSLQSNNFIGTLPTNLCHLSSLQILDLSKNKFSGNIPSCVFNFVAMAHNVNLSSEVMLPSGMGYYSSPIEEAEFYRALIMWKGVDRLFQKNLELVKLINLSNNNLSGEIPTALMSLLQLDSLDLSGNNFHGSIPNQIGQLKSLEVLNLSDNKLSGPIPLSLSDIFSLGVLDLSHNNLSGRIPTGTQLQSFNSSAFSGNSELCGLPLQVKCSGDVDDSAKALQPSAKYESDKEDKSEDKQYFYAGLGAGFACGFFGILGSLIWIRKWRYAFSEFATRFGESKFLM